MAGSVASGTSSFLFASYESRLRLTPPSAIASCASVSSIPISFSAWCIISLVMRGAGVGDGLGDGTGVGEGVCARASSGSFVAVRPAAPRAGSSFTKVRRSTFALRVRGLLFFFMVTLAADLRGERRLFIHGNHRSRANTLRARFSVLQLHDFGFAETIDRDDVEVVVFALGNYRVSLAAQLRHHRRNSVVVAGDENGLAAIARLDSPQ